MSTCKRLRRAGVFAVTASLVLLTAACSGSQSSSGSSSSTGTGGAVSAYASRVFAFARCMRTHGIPNYPDPDSHGRLNKEALRQLGISGARLQVLQRPCIHLFPTGSPPLTAQEQQDYLRAAACMRSHGIASFPDPSFSGGGVHFPIPAGLDPNSQAFTRARQTCARLIPPGLPGSESDG